MASATTLEHVRRMLEEIQCNYTQRVTLGTLARVLGRQPAHLGRLFRGEVGMTVHDYVTRARVIFGATEVRSGVKVEAVALYSGYRSKKNFYRQFRRRFGTTPDAYRNAADAHVKRAASHVERSTALRHERLLRQAPLRSPLSAPVAVLVTDATTAYVGANDSAVSLTGYSGDELRGLQVDALFPHLAGTDARSQMQIFFAASTRSNAVLQTKSRGPVNVHLICTTNVFRWRAHVTAGGLRESRVLHASATA